EHADLPRRGTVRVKLSSLPHQLALVLQVALRDLSVVGGWWAGGSTLAMKTTANMSVSAIGHFKYSLEDRTIEVSCFGSTVLISRVLNALTRVRDAGYEGIKFEDLDLACDHTSTGEKERVFGIDEITEAAEEGKSFIKCKKCGLEHSIFDLYSFYTGKEPEAPKAKPEAKLSLPRWGSSKSTFGEDPGLLHLQKKLGEPNVDADAVQFACSANLKKLQGIFSEKSAAGRCKGIWLVYEEAGGTRTAYPLRCRLDADFVLAEDCSVDVTGQELEPSQAGSTTKIMEEVFRGIVRVLDILPDAEATFVSLLWSCADATRVKVKQATQDFHQVDHPETGRIWIHPGDYTDFTSSIALAVSKETAAVVRDQVESSRKAIEENRRENKIGFDAVTAAIGGLRGEVVSQGDQIKTSIEKSTNVIFQMHEVKKPRCFIILPYRLERDESGAARAADAEAANAWFGCFAGMASTATKLAKDPTVAGRQLLDDALKEVVGGAAGEDLFLYLVDEKSGQPVWDGEVYPVKISVRGKAAQDIVKKLMPAMNIGLKVAKVASSGATLARVFGIPAPSLSGEQLEKAAGFVGAMEEKSTVASFDYLQECVGDAQAGAGEGKKTKMRGAGLREFDRFLEKHDGKKVYEKLLERVRDGDEIIWRAPAGKKSGGMKKMLSRSSKNSSFAEREEGVAGKPAEEKPTSAAVAPKEGVAGKPAKEKPASAAVAPMASRKKSISLHDRVASIYEEMVGKEVPEDMKIAELVDACEAELGIAGRAGPSGGMAKRVKDIEDAMNGGDGGRGVRGGVGKGAGGGCGCVVA
ncbi:hypothetical protein TeGR_g4030, partial [Tetraparma gracilis]